MQEKLFSYIFKQTCFARICFNKPIACNSKYLISIKGYFSNVCLILELFHNSVSLNELSSIKEIRVVFIFRIVVTNKSTERFLCTLISK